MYVLCQNLLSFLSTTTSLHLLNPETLCQATTFALVLNVAHNQEENLVYFMPAVLRNANEEELHIEQSSTDPVPLMISFKCGFVPIGMFCAMIASLVARKDNLGCILQEPHKNRSQEQSHISHLCCL